MKGVDRPTGEAIYGEQGVPAPGNNPPRAFGAIGWNDSTDHLWLMGGIVGPANETSAALWNYNTATGNWTWINGSSRVDEMAVYPAEGVTAHPGARSHAPAWYGASGRLWLFGGIVSYDPYPRILRQNDLWYFEPETAPAQVDWNEAVQY